MATAKNDITGDMIASRLQNKNYHENYDKIFPENYGEVTNSNGLVAKKCSRRCWVEFDGDNIKCNKPNCEVLHGNVG